MEESMLVENLTLYLLYVQSWREKVAESIFVARSWKGYDFDVLDRLMEKEYISGSKGARSVILTNEGVKKGEEIRLKLLNHPDLLALP